MLDEQVETEAREMLYRVPSTISAAEAMKYDALFGWLVPWPATAIDRDPDVGLSRGINAAYILAELLVDLEGRHPGDKEAKMLTPRPTYTERIRSVNILKGDCVPNPIGVAERMAAEPGTMLFNGNYLKGDAGDEESTIDRLVRLANGADEYIRNVLIEHYTTKDALDFVSASPTDYVPNPLFDAPGPVTKWYVEAWILHQQFREAEEFSLGIARMVFKYIDRKIATGEFDLKKIINYLGRLGKDNVKIYLLG